LGASRGLGFREEEARGSSKNLLLELEGSVIYRRRK
jgi:hypothetical protein